MRNDVYAQVTDKIIADLEKGELTWLKPWNAGYAGERITRPLRHNGLGYGVPYRLPRRTSFAQSTMTARTPSRSLGHWPTCSSRQC